MQDVPHTPHARIKSLVALVLTFSAGTVDIVGYIAVYHLFAANMTGNTVHLGNEIAVGNWAEAAKAGSIVAAFLLGSILGRSVIEAGVRRGWRTIASVTLLLEAVLVATFVWTSVFMLDSSRPQAASTGVICGLLALLAAAMGLQTATLTRIGPLTIHTTFVTGMLNTFAQAISHWHFWAYDERRRGCSVSAIVRRSGENSASHVAKLMAGIWFCYMAGAVAGTSMNSRWSTRSLYLPTVLLILVAVVDRFRPLSLEEQRQL
jgi:uncharacterized membrane protein YoaK (UPF0700 family)